MPIGVGTALLISGAATAGAAALGSHAASNASKDANRLQDRYNRQALEAAKEEQAYQRKTDADERAYRRQQDAQALGLATENRDYARGQYANYLTRLSPYTTVGAQSVNRLGQSLGGNILATTPNNAAMPLVTMKAPDGTVKSIPSHLVSAAEAKGAVRV